MLGVGATGTLAAWTDDEYARSTFTAGTFGVEGSASGASTGFADQATAATAAVLTFTTAPTAMAPGSTVHYASFWVRTRNPSVAGTVQLLTPTFGAASTGLQAYLTYGVRLLPAATACNATAFSTPLGTSVVPTGTTLDAALATTPNAIAANQAQTHHYCVAVTLPATAPNAAQGLVAVPTWQFAAVSA